MTCKKAMQDAKKKFDAQVHALKICDNAVQELQKMNSMEGFVNNPVPSDTDVDDAVCSAIPEAPNQNVTTVFVLATVVAKEAFDRIVLAFVNPF
jgi:hypothetical protein